MSFTSPVLNARPSRCPQARKGLAPVAAKAQKNEVSSFLLAAASAAILSASGPASAASPNVIDNIKDFVNEGGPEAVGDQVGESLRSNPQVQQLRESISVPRPPGGGSSNEAEKSAVPNPMQLNQSQPVTNAKPTKESDESAFYKTGKKSTGENLVDEVAKVEGPSTEERFASRKAGGKGAKSVSLSTVERPAELFRLAAAPSAVSDLNEAKNYTGNEQATGQYVNNSDQNKAPEVPTEGIQAGIPETLPPNTLTDQDGGFKPVFLNEENMYDLRGDKNEEASFYQSDKQTKSDEDNIVDKVAAIESPSTTERFGSDKAAGKGVQESPEKRFY